jgi:hypothetical protein
MRDSINETNEYSTSDFILAVTLLSLDFEIRNFDATNPQRIEFIFEEKCGLSESVNDFWANRSRVNPKAFSIAQRELKGRINQIVR